MHNFAYFAYFVSISIHTGYHFCVWFTLCQLSSDIGAFRLISLHFVAFRCIYVKLQAVFTSTKLLPHLVEFGPSPTQGTETMLLEHAKIFHLPCLPKWPKAMPSVLLIFPLTWFK